MTSEILEDQDLNFNGNHLDIPKSRQSTANFIKIKFEDIEEPSNYFSKQKITQKEFQRKIKNMTII